MVACGVSESTIKDAKTRNSASWTFLKDPEDKRKVLVHYDDLKDKYKELVCKHYKCEDPYEYCRIQTLVEQFFKRDDKAWRFYNTYNENGFGLTPQQKEDYTTGASWLNLLIEVDATWSKCKKALGMDKKPELYTAVTRIFEVEQVKLPKAYARLKEKMRVYEAEGYACLISDKIGNANSKKVKDEVALSQLLKLLKHHNQLEDTLVCLMYNDWAVKSGYKMITDVTVGNYRRKHEQEIILFREGTAAFKQKYGKNVKQELPSAPLLLVNSDDNDLDIYFVEYKRDRNGNLKTNYYHRPVLIVVTDAFNNYPLGFAIGDQPTNNLVKLAYLNAAEHIRELTGEYYFFHQIKADRWGIKSLAPFYQEMGNFTPTAVKNAKGKSIELSFGANWHQMLKLTFENGYSGHNITSKSAINREALELNKKNFYTKDEAYDKIYDFIFNVRNRINRKTGLSKREEWLQAWENTSPDRKKQISQMEMYQAIGLETSRPVTIRNQAVTTTIGGVEYQFDIPDAYKYDTANMQVRVKYNPYNMSSALIESVDERFKLVVEETATIPMALADFQAGDRTRLNEILNAQKNHIAEIAASDAQRNSALLQANQAQSLIKAGILLKETKREAEMIYLNQVNSGSRHTAVIEADPVDDEPDILGSM